MTELTLVSLAAFASIIGVFLSAWQVYRRRKAEQQLLMLLSAKLSGQDELVRRVLVNPTPPDPDALQQSRGIIEDAAASMKEPDRQLVLRGLHQRSNTGSTAYIVRLFSKSRLGQQGSAMPTV